MGCVSSKKTVSVTPVIDLSVAFRGNAIKGKSGKSVLGCGEYDKKKDKNKKQRQRQKQKQKKKGNGLRLRGQSKSELDESGRGSSKAGSEATSFRLGRNLQRLMEGELVAAGWPAWLCSAAGEAIQGWVPLRADAFEKLEKIGQGTYSCVFRARHFETGKIVALKKVRFDNFDPDSVRFMAREIMILRRLDHPNIIKLDGLITSRLSSSIYLVFEYMEHDITGLLSCPDIKFSESQIKCYMKQLISALEHCHSRGVMHRDIKGSNLLVNNEGMLKMADFGLANFSIFVHGQPLTSRVVTLWYRPPELLLGSTDYGPSVDLWSVGCVFAELLVGKPILQGRTEVEQLHKIFKLCGSPPDEYWKRSRHPHATLFKPQQPYDSCLRETFKDFPPSSVNLIETLLSVEPYKRGTASSLLSSEYFVTEPYACEPSSLPVYQPCKEIDAKHREEARRKKTGARVSRPETRKPPRKPLGTSTIGPREDMLTRTLDFQKPIGNAMLVHEESATLGEEQVPNPLMGKAEDASHAKNKSHGDIPFSGPLISVSSGFLWARGRKDDASIRSHSRSMSKGYIFYPLDSSTMDPMNNDSKMLENEDICGSRGDSKSHDQCELSKIAMQNEWGKFDCSDASDEYLSRELSLANYRTASKRSDSEQEEKVEFSGPLPSKIHAVDELLEKHEEHGPRAMWKPWFQRGKKRGK